MNKENKNYSDQETIMDDRGLRLEKKAGYFKWMLDEYVGNVYVSRYGYIRAVISESKMPAKRWEFL